MTEAYTNIQFDERDLGDPLLHVYHEAAESGHGHIRALGELAGNYHVQGAIGEVENRIIEVEDKINDRSDLIEGLHGVARTELGETAPEEQITTLRTLLLAEQDWRRLYEAVRTEDVRKKWQAARAELERYRSVREP